MSFPCVGGRWLVYPSANGVYTYDNAKQVRCGRCLNCLRRKLEKVREVIGSHSCDQTDCDPCGCVAGLCAEIHEALS